MSLTSRLEKLGPQLRGSAVRDRYTNSDSPSTVCVLNCVWDRSIATPFAFVRAVLLRPQRKHRIDPRGATSRNERCREGNDYEQDCDPD
jgi:hypothetical protein